MGQCLIASGGKMRNQKGNGHIGLILFLAVVYLVLFTWGSRGWGYMGYRGYHRGPSWWYFGGDTLLLWWKCKKWKCARSISSRGRL